MLGQVECLSKGGGGLVWGWEVLINFSQIWASTGGCLFEGGTYSNNYGIFNLECEVEST